jgi:hypothetical protein
MCPPAQFWLQDLKETCTQQFKNLTALCGHRREAYPPIRNKTFFYVEITNMATVCNVYVMSENNQFSGHYHSS